MLWLDMCRFLVNCRSQSVIVTSDQAVYKRYFTFFLDLLGKLYIYVRVSLPQVTQAQYLCHVRVSYNMGKLENISVWIRSGNLLENGNKIDETYQYSNEAATLLCRKDEGDYFSRNFVCILRTTTTHHMVSFIDFYFHFLANYQTKILQGHPTRIQFKTT